MESGGKSSKVRSEDADVRNTTRPEHSGHQSLAPQLIQEALGSVHRYMAFLARLWRSLGSRSRFVGRDLEGNKFYENPSSSDDPRRTKRTVQYYDPEDVWKYIGGGKRLPVQWSAWLTHTRHFPPTIEELHADVARQQRTRANVKMIEMREREERAEIQRLNALGASTHTDIPQSIGPQAHAQVLEPAPSPPPVQNASTSPKMAPNDVQHPSARSKLAASLPNVPSSDTYEPQSWTPRARGRG